MVSSISGGFQTAVYILGPLWMPTVFGTGPEVYEQSGIYNGLMMEQLFWDSIWCSYEDSQSWSVKIFILPKIAFLENL